MEESYYAPPSSEPGGAVTSVESPDERPGAVVAASIVLFVIGLFGLVLVLDQAAKGAVRPNVQALGLVSWFGVLRGKRWGRILGLVQVWLGYLLVFTLALSLFKIPLDQQVRVLGQEASGGLALALGSAAVAVFAALFALVHFGLSSKHSKDWFHHMYWRRPSR